MKSHLGKRVIATATAGIVLLGATAALAGLKGGWPAYVYKSADGSGYAFGSMAAIRGSGDSYQDIRCTITWASANCSVTDSTGKYLGCQTTDPIMMAAARTFGTDSGMQINVNASGTCTGIYIYNFSAWAPKAP